MHHIIADAWSNAIFVRELVTIYSDLLCSRAVSLTELPLQYADYAVWQQKWLSGEIYHRHLEYWRARLAGELPVVRLPLDCPREQRTGNAGRRTTFVLDAALAEQLRDMSRANGTTLYMTLLAGFLVLLHRYEDQQDLAVGLAIAGRDRQETEHLIGCLINMLVLRFDLSSRPGFQELLAQVRQVTLEAYEYQAMPFDHLVRELNPPRRKGVTPFFQVAFGMQNAPLGELALPGLEIQPLEQEEERIRYDLTLWVAEEGDMLTVDWTYATELFEPATIARMASSYETLLRAIVAAPETRIHHYQTETEQEREERTRQAETRQASLNKKMRRMRRKRIG